MEKDLFRAKVMSAIRLLANGCRYSSTAICNSLGGKELSSIRQALIPHRLQVSYDANSDTEFWQIKGGMELLSAAVIAAMLDANGRSYFQPVRVLDSTTSTNDEARHELQVRGQASRGVWLAEQQTAGRGRQGRAWYSPLAENIYCTCIVRMSPLQAAQGFSLAVGVAVILAVHKFSNQKLYLKWPNDLFYAGKKVGGILLESVDKDVLLVGIGLNVRLSSHGDKIDQPWQDLSGILGFVPSRNLLIATILNSLAVVTRDFQALGFAAIANKWSAFDYCYNKNVIVVQGQKSTHGVASGVDSNGALLVTTDTGVIICNSGEISLKFPSLGGG